MPYDDCSKALEICPNVAVQVNNIDATISVFGSLTGADNFNFCFTPNNSIWLTFQTNSVGGFTQIDFSNPVFETNANQGNEIQASILRAGAPCDGSTYTPTAGACISNASGNFSLSANLLPSSTYYVVVSGAKNAGATLAAEFTLDVLLSGAGVNRIVPKLDLITDTLILCPNTLATFVAKLTNCPDSLMYQWYVNGNLIAQTPDAVFQTSALQNGDVVSVSNSCFLQCTVLPSDALPAITVIDIQLDAGPDFSIAPNESVTLQGSTSAFQYFWTPTTNISNTGILSPSVSPQVTTSYFLTAVKKGCLLSDEAVVFVDLKLIITNSFTPNDDGANDTWEIPGLINYPNCLVQIYDRWGQQVFSATGYNEKKAWDGKVNGKAANESVYFYTIDLRDGDRDLIKGSVTLIR